VPYHCPADFPHTEGCAKGSWMLMTLHDVQACPSKTQLTRSHPTQQQGYTELLSLCKVWGMGRDCTLASVLSWGFGGRFTLVWQEVCVATSVLFCHEVEMYISEFSQKESDSPSSLIGG